MTVSHMMDRVASGSAETQDSNALVLAAAEGRLPAWAVVRPKRYRHLRRVAELMDEWARGLGSDAGEQTRWRATGWLHDALRDAGTEDLRALLPAGPFASLPGSFLHGPATAVLLERDGVTDPDMLDAIRYHTLGHAGPGRLGRALMIADFIEPGRAELPVWRSSMRARMPAALDEVFAEVVRMRLRVTIEEGKPLRPEFIAMYNAVVSRAGPA